MLTDYESLCSWIRDLAEIRGIRARRVLAKWLITWKLPSVLGLPVPPLEVPKVPRKPLPPKDFSGPAPAGGRLAPPR